jgi:hypothetical protein
VTHRLRRRVGVSGPGVEMAMDDLEGVLLVELVMMGRDGLWGRGFIEMRAVCSADLQIFESDAVVNSGSE